MLRVVTNRPLPLQSRPPPRPRPRTAVRARPFDDAFTSLDRVLDALEADVDRLETHTREWSSERVEVTPGGGRAYARSYARLVVATPAAPPTQAQVPSLLSGTTLGTALLLGAWAAVAAKLWRGFGRTRFRADARLPMSAGWPLLAAGSATFRREMAAALRAANEESEGGETGEKEGRGGRAG